LLQGINKLTPKERLTAVLSRKKADRAPVICPGGMMNAAVMDVMNKTGHRLPEAHTDGALMAELAGDVYEQTGFENLGVPFDVTAEAEAMGSEVDYGSFTCEPKVAKERFPSVSKASFKEINDLLNSGRINTVVRAVRILSSKYPEVPVVGNIAGPVTTAASLVDPSTLLKELRKDRENSHRVIGDVVRFLIEYARSLVGCGADAVCVTDPTASGEILGPKTFEEYAVRYLKEIVEAVHDAGAPVMVHICGYMKTVAHFIPAIGADAVSTDAMVNLRALKQAYPELTAMGNVSTYLLEFGPADKIARTAKKLVRDGVDIISPACGLSTSTSLEHIRVMTATVKGNRDTEDG